MTLNDAIEAYTEARLDYDDAKEISDNKEKDYRAKRAALVEAMISDAAERQAKPGIKLENGLGFNLRNQFSVSCNQENEEQVKDWLHEHYGDIEEFVIPKVHKPTVEARLKSDIEGELLDEFDVPDFMNLKTRPDVSCTGWKTFSNDRRH